MACFEEKSLRKSPPGRVCTILRVTRFRSTVLYTTAVSCQPGPVICGCCSFFAFFASLASLASLASSALLASPYRASHLSVPCALCRPCACLLFPLRQVLDFVVTDGVRYDTGPEGAFYHAMVTHVREADKGGNIVTYRQDADGKLTKTGVIEKVDPQASTR